MENRLIGFAQNVSMSVNALSWTLEEIRILDTKSFFATAVMLLHPNIAATGMWNMHQSKNRPNWGLHPIPLRGAGEAGRYAS